MDNRFTTSCPATELTAQIILSTVDISPESISTKNRYKNHLGQKAITAPTFVSCVSDIAKPVPAAKKPNTAKEIGTAAKIKAAVIIVRFTLSAFTQNTRCQNIWSPKVPDNRPIVVGIPKDRATIIPVAENKLPKSPVIPPRPLNSASGPALENIIGNPNNKTITIQSIFQKSVTILLRIPLANVYKSGHTAMTIVVAVNDIPVIFEKMVAPASN